jgi:hypothetical protein
VRSGRYRNAAQFARKAAGSFRVATIFVANASEQVVQWQKSADSHMLQFAAMIANDTGFESSGLALSDCVSSQTAVQNGSFT